MLDASKRCVSYFLSCIQHLTSSIFAASAASCEDEISALITDLKDRAVARRRPGAVPLRGTVVDDRKAEFAEEFQRRQPLLRVLSQLFEQILDKYAAVWNGGQRSARHRRPAGQILQFGGRVRSGTEGLARQENAAREAGIGNQENMPRFDPANGIAQIAVGNPIGAAVAQRVSWQPVALFALLVPLSVPGIKDQEVIFGPQLFRHLIERVEDRAAIGVPEHGHVLRIEGVTAGQLALDLLRVGKRILEAVDALVIVLLNGDQKRVIAPSPSRRGCRHGSGNWIMADDERFVRLIAVDIGGGDGDQVVAGL